jgi:hypothetical protein
MAVAFDAATNVAAGTGNLSWTHTPVGTPKGIVVFIVQNAGATDEVTSVTYGGVAMTEITGSPVLHSTGESGAVYAYFLGTGIPTGGQTVAVTVNATGSSKRAVAFSVTAATSRTKVQTQDATINSDSLANPSVTLSLSSVSCWCAIGFHSGQNQPAGITPLASWTGYLEHDFGNQNAGFYRYDTVGTANVTAGWTQTAEDAVMIAVAIAEDNITLVANAGSYSITGNAMSPKKTSLLTAAVGSYVLTGNAMSPKKTSKITADVGTIIITGNDMAPKKTSLLTAGIGNYTLTGNAMDAHKQYLIPLDSGAFSLVGNDLLFQRSYVLGAVSGTFAIVGNAVSFTYIRNRRRMIIT